MTERTFVAGDKIAVWVTGRPETRQEVFLAQCSNTREECQGLHLYSPYDDSLPFLEFEEAVVKHPEEIEYELVTAFEDALPTEPGAYIEDGLARVQRSLPDMPGTMVELIFNGMLKTGEISSAYERWVLNEDGTWTDGEGTTRPAADNWMLVVSDYRFIPAAEYKGREPEQEVFA